MVQNEFCSYLRNKKYLLPVAWIHRLVRYSINKRKKELLKKNLTSSYKDIKRRNDYLSSCGLL